MTPSNPVSPKSLARTLSTAVLVLAALPVFAVLTVGMRFLIPAALVSAVLAAVFSPSFRRWFL